MDRQIVKCFSISLFLATVLYIIPSQAQALPSHSQIADTAIPQLSISPDSNISCSREEYHFTIRDMTCKCRVGLSERHKRDDYQYTPGMGAHKYHNRGKTWNEARKICNEEGGHLAVIDSDAEEKILLHLATLADTARDVVDARQAFIGIHDLFSEGEWVTVLNDPLYKHGYTKWTSQLGVQPDNAGGKEHCGALIIQNSAGQMNDLPCSIKQTFFCEIPESQLI